MKKIDKKINSFCDFLWVLQAFLRGKALRQKAYRPQDNFFRLPVSVTAKRIMMLIWWWGRRPLTLNEVKTLMNQETKQEDDSDRVPFLYWNDNRGWGWHENNSGDWGNHLRFLAVRH